MTPHTQRSPGKVSHRAKSQDTSNGKQRLKVNVPTGTDSWASGTCHMVPQGEEARCMGGPQNLAANLTVYDGQRFPPKSPLGTTRLLGDYHGSLGLRFSMFSFYSEENFVRKFKWCDYF